jgi:hypothetical protein
MNVTVFGGMFPAVKNSVTAHCLFHIDIIAFNYAIFTAVNQKPVVTEL